MGEFVVEGWLFLALVLLEMTLSVLSSSESASLLRLLPSFGIRWKRLASLLLVVGDRSLDFLSASVGISAVSSVFEFSDLKEVERVKQNDDIPVPVLSRIVKSDRLPNIFENVICI